MRCPQGDPGTLKTTEVQLKRRCRVATLNSDSLSDDPATMRDLFDKEIGRISGALATPPLQLRLSSSSSSSRPMGSLAASLIYIQVKDSRDGVKDPVAMVTELGQDRDAVAQGPKQPGEATQQHHSHRVAMETADRHTSRVRDGERNRDNEGGGQEERERYLMLRPQPQINRPTHWPPSRTLSPISLLSIPLLSRQAARMAGMETFADGSTGHVMRALYAQVGRPSRDLSGRGEERGERMVDSPLPVPVSAWLRSRCPLLHGAL
ncbi:hypothetical protein NQZ68_026060 [Dissostichus eleginoides]|nr:hypothetical protein NQZ68_026060 [Dissostichus eleginoides]